MQCMALPHSRRLRQHSRPSAAAPPSSACWRALCPAAGASQAAPRPHLATLDEGGYAPQRAARQAQARHRQQVPLPRRWRAPPARPGRRPARHPCPARPAGHRSRPACRCTGGGRGRGCERALARAPTPPRYPACRWAAGARRRSGRRQARPVQLAGRAPAAAPPAQGRLRTARRRAARCTRPRRHQQPRARTAPYSPQPPAPVWSACPRWCRGRAHSPKHPRGGACRGRRPRASAGRRSSGRRDCRSCSHPARARTHGSHQDKLACWTMHAGGGP